MPENNERIHSVRQALAARMRVAARHDAEHGATMVEYAMLLVLVLIVAFVSIFLLGDTIIALFEFAAATFNSSPGTS